MTAVVVPVPEGITDPVVVSARELEHVAHGAVVWTWAEQRAAAQRLRAAARRALREAAAATENDGGHDYTTEDARRAHERRTVRP